MQLTRTADYGVRAMTYLAACAEGTRASVAEVAAAADVPASLMSKILQRLASARLVVSYRGKEGGFELARPAAQLSLLDVLVAMEGPLCLNLCLLSGEACDRRPWCAAHLIWAEVQKKMAAVLGAASLAELARVSASRRAALSTGARP
ncbi:MAG: Rrf2 family transcriptional regulator [Acidobacteria bacterium]|nr:Rrf2 family transcriptional regulator [Acidobacteriota bacterium]